MKVIAKILVLVAIIVVSTLSHAAGLPPWKFGMSKAEVVSFGDSGPYKYFSNGDPETFNGIFDSRRENIQFYFGESGLRRISVVVYEGKDLKAAREKWRQAYESLESLYGTVETPTIKIEPAGAPTSPEILAIAASADVSLGGKVQMAPKSQPPEEFIFSNFSSFDSQGERHYRVVINIDARA